MNITYYFYHDGNNQKGPFSFDELINEPITPSTAIWKEGSPTWVTVSELPELASLFTPTNGANEIPIKKQPKGKKVFWGLALISILILASYFIIQKNYPNILEKKLLPPKLVFKVSHHKAESLSDIFTKCNLSGYNKSLVEACDYDKVRNYSVKVAGKSPGEFNLGQVCDIWDDIMSKWKYVNDPKPSEYIAKASETIKNNFSGDCDDFAVLLCSSILAIGGESRISFVIGDDGGHAFAEVNLGITNTYLVDDYIRQRYKNVAIDGIWSRNDHQGNQWLNLDWFAKYPGGQGPSFREGMMFFILQQYCEDFKVK